MRTHAHASAIAYALTGFTLWVGGDSCLKFAGATAVPKYEILLLGSFAGMLPIFAATAIGGKLSHLRPRHPRELASLGLLAFFTVICWLIGLPRLPLVTFYSIVFLTPITVALLAALLLHEPLDRHKIIAIAAGFGGVLIALNPAHFFRGGGSVGELAIFAGMISFALQMLLLRVLGPKERRESTVFYPRFVTIAACLIAGAISGFAGMPPLVALAAAGSGFLGASGWLCMAEAYKRAPAATVAPFHYSQIISGALFGYLIWREVPSLNLAIGACIIIGSGLYILRHTQLASTAEIRD